MSLKRKKLYQTQGTGEDINNDTSAFGVSTQFDTSGMNSWELYQYYKNRDASWNTPDSTGVTPKEQSEIDIAYQDEYSKLLNEYNQTGSTDARMKSFGFADPNKSTSPIVSYEDGEFAYTKKDPGYTYGVGPAVGPGRLFKGLRFLKGKKGMDFLEVYFQVKMFQR